MFVKRDGVLMAHNAVMYGDVMAGDGVNLWFHVVVRADISRITMGNNVNLQDGTIVHTDRGIPLDIEPGVVAGHRALIHGRRVGRDTLVGMGAILLMGSEIGEECIIAAGCVVPEFMNVPPRSIVMGVPGRVVKTVTDEQVENTRRICQEYRARAEGLVR